MATIRKRNGRWQVQVRRKGNADISKTFTSKADATEWAREIERQQDRQELGPDRKALKGIKLKELVTRYRDEIVGKKRGGEIEVIVLNAFLRHRIVDKTLNDLSTRDFAQYRDQRLKEIVPKSLKRQLAPLHHMFKIARKEWHIPVSNPLDGLDLEVTDNKRERRLRPGEEERLLTEARKGRNPFIAPIILFALETAMRRGEILAVEFRHIDFERLSLVVPVSKNGHSRVIPLTNKAVELLRLAYASPRSGIIGPPSPPIRISKAFPTTAVALRLQWDRLCGRAQVGPKGKPSGLCDDLNFHDLRHEAISRLFELGLSIPEVASISGHRTPAMLFRYAHANNDVVRAKLIGERRPQTLMVETASGADHSRELIA